MKIGIDIMGGDYAPEQTMLGAIAAQRELASGYQIVLIGDEPVIKNILRRENVSENLFSVVHAPDVIGMAEHPTRAIAQKPNSSIAVGFGLLKKGQLDAFTSAGNTGAVLVGSMFSVKTILGILRPAISTLVPKEDGTWGLLLDVGVNADCKPEMLQQFAILGSLFAEHILHTKNPKVGLMNIGEEEEKGNALSQAAHQLIKNTKDINFIGNVEGRDMFNQKADVIVCDGFTGNVILKLAETFHVLMVKRNFTDEYFNRFDYETYGGAPVLGINSTVLIGHGISNAKAIKSMILMAQEILQVRLAEKITSAFQVTVAAGE